jgi:SAM-dependent methyltransferase
MGATVSDRERWNNRYADGDEGGTPLMLGRNLHLFPRSGRALDVAGGPGQAAVILAARGLDVTVCDVSEVALEMATARAQSSRVDLVTCNIDLTTDPFPPGPWDLITCFNYLDRSLFPTMIDQLSEGGQLALTLATRSNLERNVHPRAEFLLDDGELPTLIGDLSIEYYEEGWKLDGRYCAEVLARKV